MKDEQKLETSTHFREQKSIECRIVTWILKTKMTFGLGMPRVQDLLGNVLRHDFIEDIVGGKG